MEHELREFSTSPLTSSITTDEINKSSRMARYERPPTGVASSNRQSSTTAASVNRRHTEVDRRLLLEKDMSDAHEKGFWVCRLWQLLLTLNITIILTTIVLMLLFIFIIGPLSPYQTYGQSCKMLSCNAAHGLVCNTKSICLCPSNDSYWSYNETGCRRCPNGWSTINGKCLFISTFNLNWTDAIAYCKSFTAQLLTLSTTKIYSSLTLSQIKNLVSSNTTYFIGLSEQPNDSGNWQWVDGSSISSSSMNLFCTNGSVARFDTIFRVNMNCGIYRMDSCLARYTCQRADINFICEKI
ncbi:unnamed protein product [Rotaria sordida]|uniref:C-type lectin domain-containing protein n=1 Tax=Rotaria sordida TaxID=392033 RepID=A0A819HIG1_9BILA|nr:unnamed protein product [Rotaria sordida]CAF3897881.1 unnamed protein product [Rotaria sordida]